jgi:hypothetical protein
MSKNRREMHVKKIDMAKNASRESAGSKQTPAGRHPARVKWGWIRASWPGPQAECGRNSGKWFRLAPVKSNARPRLPHHHNQGKN